MEPVSYGALRVSSGQMEIATPLKPAAVKPEDSGMSFRDLMGGMISEVNRLQKTADQAVTDVVTGKRSDIHNVAIKMDEASVAFDLLLQIRNKMVEGFKEIQRVQA